MAHNGLKAGYFFVVAGYLTLRNVISKLWGIGFEPTQVPTFFQVIPAAGHLRETPHNLHYICFVKGTN